MHLIPYLCISFAITNGSKIKVSLKNHTRAYEHNCLSLSYGLDPLFQLNPRSGCCRASLTTAATATAQLDLSPAPSTDAAAPTCWTTRLARFQERVRRQTTHRNKTSVHTWDRREQVQILWASPLAPGWLGSSWFCQKIWTDPGDIGSRGSGCCTLCPRPPPDHTFPASVVGLLGTCNSQDAPTHLE